MQVYIHTNILFLLLLYASYSCFQPLMASHNNVVHSQFLRSVICGRLNDRSFVKLLLVVKHWSWAAGDCPFFDSVFDEYFYVSQFGCCC